MKEKAIPKKLRVNVILRVDAVAFQPLVTVCEDGKVHSLMSFECLENSDLVS
jgi:hypothetical protein